MITKGEHVISKITDYYKILYDDDFECIWFLK